MGFKDWIKRNILDKTNLDEMGNEYWQGRVVKPYRTAKALEKDPSWINRRIGNLNAMMTGYNLTPIGMGLNTVESGIASMLESARKTPNTQTPFGGYANLLSTFRKNLADPTTGIVSTGLGQKGALGFIGDLLLDPTSAPNTLARMSKLPTNAADFVQYASKMRNPKLTIENMANVNRKASSVSDILKNRASKIGSTLTQKVYPKIQEGIDIPEDILKVTLNNPKSQALANKINRAVSLQGSKTYDLSKSQDYIPYLIRQLGDKKVNQLYDEFLKFPKEKSITNFNLKAKELLNEKGVPIWKQANESLAPGSRVITRNDIKTLIDRGYEPKQIKDIIRKASMPEKPIIDPNEGKGFLPVESVGEIPKGVGEQFTSNRPTLVNIGKTKDLGVIDDLHTIDSKTGKLISKPQGVGEIIEDIKPSKTVLEMLKPKVGVPIVQPIKTKPLKEILNTKTNFGTRKQKNVTLLNQSEFGMLKDREAQLDYISKMQTQLHSLAGVLGRKLNDAGIKIKDYETGKVSNKQTEIVKKMFSKFADFIEKVDPKFNRRKDYISHMLAGKTPESIFKEIEDGIWIGIDDLEMGNINKMRLDKLKPEDIEQDWIKILQRYSDQSLNKLYIQNLQGSDPFQKAVLGYTKQVNNELISKTGKARQVQIPDFVNEGNRVYRIEQEANLGADWMDTVFRTNNNIFKKIGGALYEKWGKLRDLENPSLKELTADKQRAVKTDYFYRRSVALQEFIEQAGKTKFTDGSVQKYVNEQIANFISKRQLERSTIDVVADTLTSVFARAHLWFSTTTGTKQLLETTRLPAYYFKNPKAMKDGMARLMNPSEVKRASATYQLKDFDDPLEFEKIRKELMDSLAKDGADPKQAGKIALEMADKIGFGFLTGGERLKNITYSLVAEQDGLAKGLKVGTPEMYKYVREMLFEQGNVASRFNKASFFDKSLFRLLFQYSQYPIKNTVQIVDAIKGKETKKALGLMGSQIFNIAAIMGITGISAKYAFQQLLPLNVGPVSTFTANLIDNMTNQQYSENTRKQKISRLLKQNIMPAGTQYVRSSEGYQASKGFDTSPAGRIRYFGEKENIPNTVKGMLYGKYALPDVKNYYDEGRSVLGEKQSKIFSSLPADKATAYGKNIMTDIAKNSELPDFSTAGELKEPNPEQVMAIENNSDIFFDKFLKDTMLSEKRSQITSVLGGKEAGVGNTLAERIQFLKDIGITEQDIEDWKLYKISNFNKEDKADYIMSMENPDFVSLYKNDVISSKEVLTVLEEKGFITDADILWKKLEMTDPGKRAKLLKDIEIKYQKKMVENAADTEIKMLKEQVTFHNKSMKELLKKTKKKVKLTQPKLPSAKIPTLSKPKKPKPFKITSTL